MKRSKNKNLENKIKARILKGLSHGIQGKEWVISMWDGKDFVFDKKDMVNAIWKIRERR